ncbi:epoxide hydrolase N-terminal domain-containing protein [Sphingomonadaceae bacterium G21617-S1]|nr:epoxide hydrolase N-terminal domain-containing protein [Sphingomonadaceae bacterium G21617-S1]
MLSDLIEAFDIQVPQHQLDDLGRRLDDTRWPEREPVDDWSQGVPLDGVRRLCEYWRTHYDWRRCEAWRTHPIAAASCRGAGVQAAISSAACC